MRPKTGIAIGSFTVFFVMIVAFIVYMASVGIRISPPAYRTALSMDVPDINNLVVGSNVLLRGVPVGKVTGIDASTTAATIHFYFDGRYQVPEDSDIRLDNLSALGESYIELEPRSSNAPMLRDGQRLAPKSVKQPPSISELGVSVVRVLNQLDPKQFSRVVGELDAGLPDPGPVLPNLAHASLLLRNTAADFKGQGRELLDNFQVLLKNAGFVGPALAAGAAPIKEMGPGITATWNAFVEDIFFVDPGMVYGVSGLIGRLQKFLDERGIDLKILGEATSANLLLIANAIRNLDSSEVLANLQATVPKDGRIDLHVAIPKG